VRHGGRIEDPGVYGHARLSIRSHAVYEGVVRIRRVRKHSGGSPPY